MGIFRFSGLQKKLIQRLFGYYMCMPVTNLDENVLDSIMASVGYMVLRFDVYTIQTGFSSIRRMRESARFVLCQKRAFYVAGERIT